MHPVLVAFVLAAALAGAASVPLTWYLGVWGWLASLGARVRVLEESKELANAALIRRLDALEAAQLGMRARLAREDGLVGREKQRQQKQVAEAREAELVVAAQQQAEAGQVPEAALAELRSLPKRRGAPPLRAAPAAPDDDGPDILPTRADGA